MTTTVAGPFLAAELAWADRFARGEVRDPEGRPVERVALRVPDAAVAALAPGEPPRVLDVAARGALVATDRRLVVITARGGRWEVAWDDPAVGRAFTERHGCGVLVFPPEAEIDAGAGLWAWCRRRCCGPGRPRSGRRCSAC